MAGRFLVEKFSRVLRSRSLVGSHVSAVTRTAPEGGIGTLSNGFSGSGGHPRAVFSTNHWIRGYAAMHFNTSPWSTAAARPRCTTGYPSVTIKRMKPSFVDSVGGGKQTFSSKASTRRRISGESNKPAWEVEWDAKKAVWEAQWAAKEAEMAAKNADFRKFMRRQVLMWAFTGSYCIVGAFSGDEEFEQVATTAA